MPDALFKIVIFGDGGVGKTTLVNKYLTGVFKSDTKITVGLDFHIKRIEFNGNKVALQIWDFAGEDRFRYLLSTYMRGAAGGLFMYDVTRYSSIKHIYDWLEALKMGDSPIQKQIPIILVGGKIDLEEKRAIECRDGYELSKSLELDGFIECSAKTGENVELIFQNITNIMMTKSGLTDLPSQNNFFKICE